MTIQLTPQQLPALDAAGEEAPRVVDPRDNTAYVLVSEQDYEAVREILEDERRQHVIREIGLRNAGQRAATPLGDEWREKLRAFARGAKATGRPLDDSREAIDG